MSSKDNINAFRLLALKGALWLEFKGMKRKGRSAVSIIRAEFGFKERTVAKLYPKYVSKLQEMGILPK